MESTTVCVGPVGLSHENGTGQPSIYPIEGACTANRESTKRTTERQKKKKKKKKSILRETETQTR